MAILCELCVLGGKMMLPIRDCFVAALLAMKMRDYFSSLLYDKIFTAELS